MSHNETRLTSQPASAAGGPTQRHPDRRPECRRGGQPALWPGGPTGCQLGAQRRGPDIGHYGDDAGAMTVAAAAQLALEDTPPGLVAATLASVEHALVATYTGAEIDGISDVAGPRLRGRGPRPDARRALPRGLPAGPA